MKLWTIVTTFVRYFFMYVGAWTIGDTLFEGVDGNGLKAAVFFGLIMSVVSLIVTSKNNSEKDSSKGGE